LSACLSVDAVGQVPGLEPDGAEVGGTELTGAAGAGLAWGVVPARGVESAGGIDGKSADVGGAHGVSDMVVPYRSTTYQKVAKRHRVSLVDELADRTVSDRTVKDVVGRVAGTVDAANSSRRQLP